MKVLSLEHSSLAYWADFALHGTAALALALHLVWVTPWWPLWMALPVAALGWWAWTLAEYGLHRWVLHGVPPFKGWHALHHARPRALVAGPTVLSATLLALVALPVWWWLPLWAAEAWLLGFMVGYLAYGLVHHATHHGQGRRGWLLQRRRWHALHHHGRVGRCYGVSTGFWDHCLGSAHTTPVDTRALPVGP